MANKQQLAILKKGVEVWNKWREENPFIAVDLSSADLSGTELSEIDFARRNLHELDPGGDWDEMYRKGGRGTVNLDGAKFVGANLWHANLGGADLIRADLTGAHLWGAALSFSNLEEAKLTGAELKGAYLEDTNLVRADLSNAFLVFALLPDADFTGANLMGANFGRTTLHLVRFVQANVAEADLSGADLWHANLTQANLAKANFSQASLWQADLTQANLAEAFLWQANLNEADLQDAKLAGADLREANLTKANLSGADLSGANLSNSIWVRTNVRNVIISKCNVYGVGVWDLEREFKEQKDLIITPEGVSPITVDNIKVAQFVYLILNNEEIRDVINTLTSKTVLILGRFAIPERKAILDALREKLREYDLLPIVFDFENPTDKDFTETIKTLASISYFVIADVTNPRSAPLELQATIPDYQIPFVPIIQEGEQPFAMMRDLQQKYNWVLQTRSYDTIDTLMKALKRGIIDPAVKLHTELRLIKAKEQVIHPLRDFLDRD